MPKGELGNGTQSDSSKPVAVSGLGSGVTAIAAGYDFALALHNGAVVGWGDGTSGQLGNGTTNSSSAHDHARTGHGADQRRHRHRGGQRPRSGGRGRQRVRLGRQRPRPAWQWYDDE